MCVCVGGVVYGLQLLVGNKTGGCVLDRVPIGGGCECEYCSDVEKRKMKTKSVRQQSVFNRQREMNRFRRSVHGTTSNFLPSINLEFKLSVATQVQLGIHFVEINVKNLYLGIIPPKFRISVPFLGRKMDKNDQF